MLSGPSPAILVMPTVRYSKNKVREDVINVDPSNQVLIRDTMHNFVKVFVKYSILYIK